MIVLISNDAYVQWQSYIYNKQPHIIADIYIYKIYHLDRVNVLCHY